MLKIEFSKLEKSHLGLKLQENDLLKNNYLLFQTMTSLTNDSVELKVSLMQVWLMISETKKTVEYYFNSVEFRFLWAKLLSFLIKKNSL